MILQGQGMATTIKLASGADCNIFVSVDSASYQNWLTTIQDMDIDGNKANNSAGKAIVLTEHIMDIRLSNLIIMGFSETAIEVQNAWGLLLDFVCVEYCEGDGLHLLGSGSHYKITNCKFKSNAGHAINATSGFGMISTSEFSCSANKSSIYLDNADYTVVSSCNFGSFGSISTEGLIYVGDNTCYCRIANNCFYGGNYGVKMHSNAAFNLIQGNIFISSVVSPVYWTNSHNIVETNYGIVHRNIKDDQRITGDGSTVAFTFDHGLNIVLLASAEDKIVTIEPKNTNMRDATYYISNITTTQFTITFSTAPTNLQNYDFRWVAEYM